MLARGPCEACRADYANMLQVALAPPPVPGGEIDEGGRALLVAALQVRKHVDGPSGAPNEGCLHEIVAHDVTAERRLAGERRHAAMRRESPRPDNRVVTPVIAFTAGPDGKAGGYDRTVDLCRELLEPREQRVAIDDEREGLDDARIRVRLHGFGQADNAWPRQKAVGIEDEHMLVSPAPAADEVLDIAGLAANVSLAVADKKSEPPVPFAPAKRRTRRSSAIQALGWVESDRMKKSKCCMSPVAAISSIIAWRDENTRAVASL